ncbi:3-oxoacyl-[acyl-carrier-protein] reductase [Saprospira grandis]|uniref:3-oxoacyl-[acyl-carrier-protein] reductase n=1 Tax=Saprospira grandis (strain Lewin) TaxID=984262 RepID=H6L5P0_SAPGL|nr:3-oxoacyl-[acyl-carrier-protein] reductase [Saprospira grandis]AFC26290.1 3-oxoacyl-(acyl-carrier-protein) reductase [Saprospira grandis str. Lewin]
MKLLAGKVALVTGGSRGIGSAIVKKFAEQGAHVVFTYRSSSEQAEALAKEAEALSEGIKVLAYQSDAADFDQAAQLIKDIVKEFGQIDVLVNNAGITRDNLLLRMNEQQWDDVMTTNLKSVFNLCKHAARPMLKARSGSIINITSIVGVNGNPGQANYAASKAGMIGFTKSLAYEMGSRGIRCNAIAPGFITTEMTDKLSDELKEQMIKNTALQRLGQGEEIANVCLFLASELSSYVTGDTIMVTGGMR